MEQIDDIPSNSQKSKQLEEEKNKKPEVPIFQGESGNAKRKNNQLGAWLRRMFLGDKTLKQIGIQVLEDNIVPGFKDNIRNSFVSGLDMFMYQGARSTNNSSTNNNVSYNNIFRSQTTTVKTQTPPKEDNSVDTNNGFENPCFTSRNEAINFLNLMKAYDYPTLSVHTMYLMRKKRIDYTWDAYGWTREEIATWTESMVVRISSSKYPYMIDLPKAHVIS